MNNQERLIALQKKVADKKVKEDNVKAKCDGLNKAKKLTQEQRLDRIEEMLGIE